MVLRIEDFVKAEPCMQVICMYISLNVILNGELSLTFCYTVGLNRYINVLLLGNYVGAISQHFDVVARRNIGISRICVRVVSIFSWRPKLLNTHILMWYASEQSTGQHVCRFLGGKCYPLQKMMEGLCSTFFNNVAILSVILP